MSDDNFPPGDPNVPDLPPTEPVIVPASDLPPTEPMYGEPVPPIAEPTVVMPAAVPPVPPVDRVPPPTNPNAAVPNGRPDPSWYENRGAVATIIAVGLLGLFLLIAWLVFWSGDDDEQDLVIESTTTATTALIVQGETIPTIETTIADATIVEGTTASTIEVTLPPETTAAPTSAPTTLPPTTLAPTTTAAPTTVATTTVATTTTPPTTEPPATTVPVVSVPASSGATVYDIIAASPDLSRLNQLITDAGLQQELDGDGPITLFAPSNPAIETLEAAPGGAALLADPQKLRALLLGHVVPQSLTAADIFGAAELTNATGGTLTIDGPNRTVEGAELLVIDVKGGNGYIQVVDMVLQPN